MDDFQSAEPRDVDPIVGCSVAIAQVRSVATRVAAGDAKVLVTGESGTGKDLVARHVHARSARVARPFVAVNCAGFSDTLLESELFGHVKGSFTGAYRDKVGKLQLAHKGTIFLDEVGEMSPRMQSLLLRALEQGEIQPVGSDRLPTKVDVRIIAATNRDLRQMVKQDAFRKDLLYRLNVVQVYVPPLRDRSEDIPLLVEHLSGRMGRRLRFTDEAMQKMQAYYWPGNVRELQNVIEHVVWLAPKACADVHDLPQSVDWHQNGRPLVERRRRVADDLYEGLVSRHMSFWTNIYELFLNRDITRKDLRELIGLGLTNANGNYRNLLKLFGIPETEYKRLLNFLAAHECTVDVRAYRQSYTPLAPTGDRGEPR
jgi:transcriptional regulator with GAF, ATPase, and Fis domain